MRRIRSTGSRCGAFSEGETSSTVNCDNTSWHGISVQLATFDVSSVRYNLGFVPFRLIVDPICRTKFVKFSFRIQSHYTFLLDLSDRS